MQSLKRVHEITLSLLVLCALLSGCSTTTSRNDLAPLEVQSNFDTERYLGRWYVIAHIPYRVENGKVGAYVEYRKRSDGRMDDLYFFRKQNFDRKLQQYNGVAWIPDPSEPARWKAQFLWPLRFDYLVLATADDYSWAIVGHPSRDLAWIFSRTPDMDPTLFAELKAKLRAQDYDDTRLQRIAQRPDQLNATGFAKTK